MGQKTGTLHTAKKVHTKATMVEYTARTLSSMTEDSNITSEMG